MAKDRQTRAREKRQEEKKEAAQKQQKQQQAEVRRSAYESMAGAGIKSLSGATTADKKGAEARETQREFYEDRGVSKKRIEELVPTLPYEDKVVTEDKKEVVPEKEQVKYYDDEKGVVSERDLKFLEKKLGQKAIIRNGRIFFIDETGSTIPYGAMIDKLGGALDKITGFKPEKAFETDNPRVAASFAHMFENMKPERWEEFISGKGNLDRIISYANTLNQSKERELLDLVTSGDTKGLAGKFRELGEGLGKDTFLDEYNKRQNPDEYYQDNPPQTLGDMEDMLRSGITMTKANTQMIQDARDRVSESQQQQGQGIGGLGGGGGALPPTDPTTDPTKVPDYVLKQQYMPGFTPDYSGGAEQMQIAGGYWDPRTQKWIGSGPWGTQSQYQFPPQTPTIGVAQGGIVGTSPLLFKNQGGMVNDNGIKAFKKYGY